MLIVGIDPPKGIAAIDENGKIVKMLTAKDTSGIFEWLNDNKQAIKKVYIEQPWGVGTKRGRGKSVGVQKRIAANVGQSYQKSMSIGSFCKAMKIPYELVHPNKILTKMDKRLFHKMTGWTDRSNEHNRDAAVLIWHKYGRLKL